MAAAAPGVVAGRAAGAVVAGLRGVHADVAVADLGEPADLLLRSKDAARGTSVG